MQMLLKCTANCTGFDIGTNYCVECAYAQKYRLSLPKGWIQAQGTSPAGFSPLLVETLTSPVQDSEHPNEEPLQTVPR